MNISQNGINLIKSFEGCKLTAYKDPVGIWTIGIGHTGDVRPGMVIDEATAITYFKNDIKRFEANVNKYNHIYNWTQNQFDAMVSYAYNIGSIDKLVDKGKRTKEEISADIPNHNKAGGKVLAGLTRRRNAEKELFDRDLPKNNVTNSNKGSVTKYYPKCKIYYTSIVMALRSLNIDATKENRKKIAAANGIDNYTGTYDQNTKLLQLLKQGKLIQV